MDTISCTRATPRSATSLRIVPQIVLTPVALGTASLYRSRCVEQYRTFFDWRRSRGEDWQARSNTKCGRTMDRADRMFYKHARAMDRRANWYSPYPVHGCKSLNRWRRLRVSEGGRTVRADESSSQKWHKSLDNGYDAEWDRIEREFQKLKRAIDTDPYGMVFGRRLQPFHFGHKPGPWSILFRNMFGPGNAGFGAPKEHIVRSADAAKTQTTRGTDGVEFSPSSSDMVSFKFDPISGRMVSKKARTELDKESRSERSELGQSNDVKDSQRPVESKKDDVLNPDGFNSPERAGKDEKPHNKPFADKSAEVDETDAKEVNGNTVLLMGEPQQPEKGSTDKPADNGDTSSIVGKAPNVESEEKYSTKVSHQEDQGVKQSSVSESWTRSPQAVLSNFKDYLSSKIKSEDPNESPDTRGWPFLLRKRPVTRAGLRDEPFSKFNGRKDMEAEQLDTLRASDVRGSFQRREPELDNKESVTHPGKEQLKDSESEGVESVAAKYPVKSDDPISPSESWFENREGSQASKRAAPAKHKGAAILSTDTVLPDAVHSSLHGSSGSIEKGKVSEPTAGDGEKGATVRSAEIDTTLEDTIRQIYEETYGKIAPVKQEQDIPEAVETAGDVHMEKKDEKSAALVTDASSMDTGIQAFSDDVGGTSTDPAIDDHPLHLSAQLDKLDRLLVDIEQANAATTALLEGVRERIETNAVNEGPSSSLDSTPPAQYRVLAYDCLTREVKNASMMSACAVPFKPLHPADAVSRLYNPSKFLPYFPVLEAQGYELFAGGPEVLVFKRIGVADHAAPSVDQAGGAANESVHSPAQAARLEQESIDQVESVKDEAQSAPSLRPPSDSASSSSSGSSSHSSRKEAHPFLRKIARRMFLTGVVTGGTCYAIGVVAEYFRTGGQDGLGPRGFTGLEGR